MMTKMTTKAAVLFLTAAAAVLAAACGGKDEGKKQENTQQTESAAGRITYDVQKCVTLGDYSKLQINVPNTYEITQESIDDYAQRMAEYYAPPVYKDTDKDTVEDGDTVNIDYEGKKDGVAFSGGTAQGAYLTIGSNSFIDGFEEGLIGKKTGETVDLNLKFPDPYPNNEELSGADVVFTVTVNKIVEKDTTVKVELTDEFVKENLKADSVKEFKKNIKGFLKASSESSKKKDTMQAVADKLKEICKVELPEGLLEARTEDYITQFKNNYCADTTLAEYLKANFNGMSEEDFRKDAASQVENNLPVEFILEVIAQKEGIELDEDKFQEFVKTMMESGNYQTAEDYYKVNGVNVKEGEAYARKLYVCNQALEKITNQADITYGKQADK